MAEQTIKSTTVHMSTETEPYKQKIQKTLQYYIHFLIDS